MHLCVVTRIQRAACLSCSSCILQYKPASQDTSRVSWERQHRWVVADIWDAEIGWRVYWKSFSCPSGWRARRGEPEKGIAFWRWGIPSENRKERWGVNSGRSRWCGAMWLCYRNTALYFALRSCWRAKWLTDMLPLPGLKCSEHEADHLLLSGVVVNNVWLCNTTSHVLSYVKGLFYQ